MDSDMLSESSKMSLKTLSESHS